MPRLFSQLDVFNKKKIQGLQTEVDVLKQRISASYSQYPNPYRNFSPIYSVPFDGEKTPGEMGAAKDYNLMYDYLRVRSWQSYLESEITQLIINKFILWTIGDGLKVQPEPVAQVLQQEGIKLSPEFSKQVETRFNVWTSSRYSDSCKMNPIDILAAEASKNAYVGGDGLIILRTNGVYTDMQLIDGAHIATPFTDSDYLKQAKARGNRIEYGVEISQSNEHIAYYVLGADKIYHRIERYGKKSGRLMAYMVYGNRYRVDNVRGLPLMSAVLETLKKLDRYKEATVGSAEERQKIAFFIEHSADSTGENPLAEKMVQAVSMNYGEAPESKSQAEYESASTKIALTTQKQTYNLPIGATIKQLESKNELYFKDFYTTNIQLVCASVGIPYEVAMAMYNSNYSASRAAIKDWEHSLKTSRAKFSSQFYQNFYNLWLEMEILNGKIQADGYIRAIMDENIMAIEAYRNARWLGPNVPHIDPLKEVAAERMKLGDDTTPLTTYDQATERLDGNDFSQVQEKVKQEKLLIPKEPQPKEQAMTTAQQLLRQEILNSWQER